MGRVIDNGRRVAKIHAPAFEGRRCIGFDDPVRQVADVGGTPARDRNSTGAASPVNPHPAEQVIPDAVRGTKAYGAQALLIAAPLEVVSSELGIVCWEVVPAQRLRCPKGRIRATSALTTRWLYTARGPGSKHPRREPFGP